MTNSVADLAEIDHLPFGGPTHVDLDLTNACNLWCSHCSVSSGKPLPLELSRERMLGLIDEIYNLGVLTLTIAGGEPLMRPDAIDILERACSHPGWRVTVITNGTYFTDEVLEGLRDRCPGLTVNVSIDGSTPEKFDVLRHRRRRTPEAQRQLFDEVTSGIRVAVAAGLKIHTSFALTKSTSNDLVSTYNLAMDLGARDMLAIKFFSGGRGADEADSMEFKYTEWAELFLQLTQKKSRGELKNLALALPSAWEFYLPLYDAGMDAEAVERIWSYRAPRKEPYYARTKSIGDPSGIADLNVVANGDVYPITLMSGNRKALAGNMTTRALENIWTESTVLRELRTLRTTDLPEKCRSCPIETVCGGGSRARALARTGNLSGADDLCPRFAH